MSTEKLSTSMNFFVWFWKVIFMVTFFDWQLRTTDNYPATIFRHDWISHDISMFLSWGVFSLTTIIGLVIIASFRPPEWLYEEIENVK